MDNMGNLGMLLGGMQQRMQEMKEKTAKARCEGTAGDGLVRIVVTGNFQVDTVEIAQGAMEDRELLEDLVRAALSEALRNVQEETQANLKAMTGGLPIPPGLLPF